MGRHQRYARLGHVVAHQQHIPFEHGPDDGVRLRQRSRRGQRLDCDDPISRGGAAARETDYFYSYRDRLVATKEGVQANEDSTTHRPIMYYEYDNLGEVIAVDQYDGDGVTITTPSGGAFPSKPSASLLRAYSTTAFDDQQRPYANVVYSVDQSSGAISSTGLTTGTWYDHRGDVIETSQPGGLVTKNQYDGAGRAVKTFTTDGSSGASWSAAGSVTGDNVLSQTETQYDADGNAILSIDRERFDNETATGALGNANTTPKGASPTSPPTTMPPTA